MGRAPFINPLLGPSKNPLLKPHLRGDIYIPQLVGPKGGGHALLGQPLQRDAGHHPICCRQLTDTLTVGKLG